MNKQTPYSVRITIMKNLGVIIIFILFISLTAISATKSGYRIDTPYILQKLKANDARFDNLELQYLKLTNHEIKPNRFHSSQSNKEVSKMPEDYWKPRIVKWVSSCSFVVRGQDAVISYQAEPSLSEKDKYISAVPYSKDGNLNGIQYELVDQQLPEGAPGKTDPNYEKQLYIHKLQSPLAGLYDTRMAVEFVHGIGFGKRIKKIDSIKPDKTGWHITGDIKLWVDDDSRFEMELDKDYLVRNAVINANVKGNHTRFIVGTKGTVSNAGLSLASSGSFQRIWQPSQQQSAKGTKPKIIEDFKVEFKKLTLHLSNDQYTQLTTFKIEPLMQVEDSVNNIHGTGMKRADGTIYIKPYNICGMPKSGEK